MTDLTIHDIPAATYEALEAHAARRGRTVEAEVGELIQEAARKELLTQSLERASRAVESVDSIVGGEPRTAPSPRRSRRRYRSVHPTPTGHGR